MDFFSGMLANSLTPITLISGVGLMLLCMVARYNHTTDRIRQLLARREVGDYENEPDIDREIHLIFRRAKYLRRAMLPGALRRLLGSSRRNERLRAPLGSQLCLRLLDLARVRARAHRRIDRLLQP